MLERIAEIKGVGLLHDANGKPHRCQKATLIYADNGRGKSTLSSILRSVSSGDPLLVSVRKTIDGSFPPEVELHFDSGHKVRFEQGRWTETRPEILVFDADFVEQNVHSGGTVTTMQRKRLLEFALGEKAVAARQKVEKATAEARAASTEEQRLARELSGHHSAMQLADFIRLPQVTDIDTAIETMQRRVAAAASAATILARRVPSQSEVPKLDLTQILANLSQKLDEVHVEANKKVREHVAALPRAGAAEPWLGEGQKFDDHKACPYCAQPTIGHSLVDAYQTYFTGAYVRLLTSVATTPGLIGSLTDVNVVNGFAQRVETAMAVADGWSDHVTFSKIEFDAEAARSSLARLKEFLMPMALAKQNAPTIAFCAGAERTTAEALLQGVLAAMVKVNATIKKAAEAIQLFKASLASQNIGHLRAELHKLESTKRRYTVPVPELVANLLSARTQVEMAEKAKVAAREELDSEMLATFGKYEESINNLLKTFGASFSIHGFGANFRGAGPRSEYGLLLRGREVALEGGPPSFATTLSEGDKRTLAFAFFVASTLADPELGKKVVIVDDPMCSLDMNRRRQTRNVLKKIHDHAEQMIVLAHDPYFIRDLRDVIRRDDKARQVAIFQLAMAASDYSGFDAFDIDKECESPYFQYHRVLREFVSGKPIDSLAVAKAIRPMLEGYLHRRFPGLIPAELLFGQVVALIKNADSSNPVAHARNLTESLDDLNDYAGQFHHDTNPAKADSVIPVKPELKTYAERALKLVHSAAPA